MKKLILFSLPLLLLAGACNTLSNSNQTYTDVGFAKVEQESLIKDGGTKYIVLTDNTDKNWKTKDRIYYSLEINSTVSESIYSTTLNGYLPVYTKDLVLPSLADTSKLGHDPLIYSGGSLSGTRSNGYLNLILRYTHAKVSPNTHTISVVKDESNSNDSKTVIIIFHDGQGDSYGVGKATSDYEATDYLLSIPFSQIAPQGKTGNFTIDIKYYGFEIDSESGTVYPQTRDYTLSETITLSE